MSDPRMNEEQFYDAEIAPALADLSKRCQARGMSFLAAVSYDDAGSIGRTIALPEKSPPMIRYLDALARCWCEGGRVNIDQFMMAVMREAKRDGHSSVILSQLGVPVQPATR